jgi:putative membrane protein
MRLPPATAVAAAWSTAAWSHDTGVTHRELSNWTLDPWILVPLGVAAALFGAGFRRLHMRAGRGSSDLSHRARLFAVGWLVLVAALVSPLHQAGERSFAAHMFEHELIMLAAAPLLVLSEPMVAMLWAFPTGARRAIGALTKAPFITAAWRQLTGPVTATLLQATALWLWHAPALFDLALASDGWHAAQHLSFLVSALLFWTAMLSQHAAAGVAALCLVATSIVSGALGALMAFATSPWYVGYARFGMTPLGLTPAEDQQLAGLLMWVPGGLVHAGAALVIMRKLLRPANG